MLLYLWLGKRRRKEGGFSGSQVILEQLSQGVDKTRVGITSRGAIARQHCEIVDQEGAVIGHVTSGCPSPTLGFNIAMGYVPTHLRDVGTDVNIRVRNRVVTGQVTQMPFVPCTYYKKESAVKK